MHAKPIRNVQENSVMTRCEHYQSVYQFESSVTRSLSYVNQSVMYTRKQKQHSVITRHFSHKKYDNFLRYRGFVDNKSLEAPRKVHDLAKLNFDLNKKIGCFFCGHRSRRNVKCISCGTSWHKECIEKRIADIEISTNEISKCSRC